MKTINYREIKLQTKVLNLTGIKGKQVEEGSFFYNIRNRVIALEISLTDARAMASLAEGLLSVYVTEGEPIVFVVQPGYSWDSTSDGVMIFKNTSETIVELIEE